MMTIQSVVKRNLMKDLLISALLQGDDIIFITDKDGVIEYVNSAFSRLYGFLSAEVLGRQPSVLSSHQHPSEFYARLWESILKGDTFHETILNQKKDGELVYVDTKIVPIRHNNDEITHFVAIAREVTQKILNEKELHKLATVDPLTQISNRYQITNCFEEYLKRAKRNNSSFALLMFDIDHFKKINDLHGHHAGDTVLAAFAQLVLQNIREVDSFGRWGGEEFLLLLENTDEHKAMQVAEKIREHIASVRIDDVFCITVSIGVSIYRKSDTKESMLSRADAALYAAKDLGRNRAVFN